MIKDHEQNGEKGLCSRTIKHFPHFFRGKSNTVFTRAMRYWKQRHKIVNEYKKQGRKGNGLSFSLPTSNGVKVFARKSTKVRGRKRTAWCVALHHDLLLEFDRLRKVGVRFNRRILLLVAQRLAYKNQSEEYGSLVRDPTKKDLIIDHINIRWIQAFMQRHSIVCRTQTGKLAVSPTKQELIEREVAYHLGQLYRDFTSGSLDEDNVYNSDETHFVFNMHSHKTLAMRGDENVKYVDVISGDEGMTMMVTISGGHNSMLSPAFIIFQKANRSYPIRGVPDNIPGVTYRSGPKGWMDSEVFKEWLKEQRVLGRLPHGKKRVLYMDNCGSHNITPEVSDILRSINTEIRFFPKNATALCQPADSFVIQKLKTVWRKKWDEKKLEMIEAGMWGSAHNGSGKLANPGKSYFLKLAADVVRELNDMRDADKVLYTSKAMIKCGLSKNLNGVWEVEQLFPHLQAIVGKYSDHFNGTPVGRDIDLTGERTESEDEA